MTNTINSWMHFLKCYLCLSLKIGMCLLWPFYVYPAFISLPIALVVRPVCSTGRGLACSRANTSFWRGQNTNLEPLFCFIWCVMLPRLLFYALEGQLHRHGQCRLFCCWSLQIMTLTYHKSACVFATLPGKFWWIRFDGGHLSFKINLIFILVNSKIVVAL